MVLSSQRMEDSTQLVNSTQDVNLDHVSAPYLGPPKKYSA